MMYISIKSIVLPFCQSDLMMEMALLTARKRTERRLQLCSQQPSSFALRGTLGSMDEEALA